MELDEAHAPKMLYLLIEERDRQYKTMFEAQKDAVHTALAAAKEAVDKAERAANERFDAHNKFRETLRDQADTLMPRNEAEIRFKALDDLFRSLSAQVLEGKSRRDGASGLWALIGGGVLLLIAVASFVMPLVKP
jgi:hypothetical protein